MNIFEKFKNKAYQSLALSQLPVDSLNKNGRIYRNHSANVAVNLVLVFFYLIYHGPLTIKLTVERDPKYHVPLTEKIFFKRGRKKAYSNEAY